jgi:hypothetical protein
VNRRANPPHQKTLQEVVVVTDPNPVPRRARNIVRQWDQRALLVPRGDVLPWAVGLERLGAGRLFWHITNADGGAHVRPVFAVVCDGMLCSTSSASARKTARLASDPRCTLATSTDDMDLVYEGVAVRVQDTDRLARIADAYHDKYGWPIEVTGDGAFDAPFAAPAAGPPPYLAYVIEPVTVRGFGTDDRYATRSTRWDFDR